MLSLRRATPRPLQHTSALSWRGPGRARARTTVTATSQASTVGPACQQLLGLTDSQWKTLAEQIDAKQCSQVTATSDSAAKALLACLKKRAVQVVGQVAADTHMPWSTPEFLVHLPDHTLNSHAEAVKVVADALSSPTAAKAGFADVKQHPGTVWLSAKFIGITQGMSIHIIVSGPRPASTLQLLGTCLSSTQRQALSGSAAAARAAFLKQQPTVYATAVKVVKSWVKATLPSLSRNPHVARSLPYLLELLLVKAYQEYVNSTAYDSLLGTSAPPDDAASLPSILQQFLKLTAGLCNSSVISWEVSYSQQTVHQVLARPDLAQVLRPEGCEQHPIVLDPFDPTNNVAAAVPDIMALAAAARKALDSTAVHQAALLAQMPRMQQQLDALCLHQRILADASGTWNLKPITVDMWRPAHEAQSSSTRTTLIDKAVPHFKLVLHPKCADAANSTQLTNKFMGLELRWSVEDEPVLKAMVDMKLPISLAIEEGSSVRISSRDDDLAEQLGVVFGTQDSIMLRSGICGRLGTESGVSWMLSRFDLYILGVCGLEPADDARVMAAQSKAGCQLHFKLKLSFD